MMKYLFVLCVVLLTGCATELQVKPTNHYSDIKSMDPIHVTVETYPETKAIVVPYNGHTVAAFEKDDFDKLREFKDKANKNAQVLTATIDASNALVTQNNALLNMAKAEERRANDLEQDLSRTETQLRNEEKSKLWDSLFYKIIIVLGLASHF